MQHFRGGCVKGRKRKKSKMTLRHLFSPEGGEDEDMDEEEGARHKDRVHSPGRRAGSEPPNSTSFCIFGILNHVNTSAIRQNKNLALKK